MNEAEKIPLSVVIIAKNEERHLDECLISVFIEEEIILYDDFTTDKTVEIAGKYGAKIFQRNMNGDFGAQQTFGIEKATKDWILLLDCDERVTPELAEEIKEKIKGKKIAYKIKRINYFLRERQNYSVFRPDFPKRLIPREGTRVEGFVHPKIIYPYKTKKIKSPLLHFTYDNWAQFMRKMEQYSRLAAEKYYVEGKRAKFFKDIVFRPAFSFFKMYFISRGFLDGKMGFIHALNHWNYTLMKYVRLYYLEREREINKK